MIEYINKCMPLQKKECFFGNREYKIYLDNETTEQLKLNRKKNKPDDFIDNLKNIKNMNKLNKRASQLRFRLDEGDGKALYMIGVSDSGRTDGIDIEIIYKSIHYLKQMAEIINAEIKNIKIYKGNCNNKYICTSRIDIPNYVKNKLPEF
jgi:GTPase